MVIAADDWRKAVRPVDRLAFHGVERWRRWRAGALVAVAVVVGSGFATPSGAATLTVTTTADDLTPNDGSVSLREAMTAISAGTNLGDPDIISQNPGPFGSHDKIVFNAPGPGLPTIIVGSSASALGIPLPIVTQPVVVDATTQAGATGTPLIGAVLDGTTAGATANGVEAQAPVTLKGLDIVRFHGFGVLLDRTPASSAASRIEGNIIGANASGVAAVANSGGIRVDSPQNTITGNLVSGNGSAGGGILLVGDMNVVQGNMIGTNATGTAAVPNGSAPFGGAVSVAGSANTIGGTSVAARNLISGNTGDAVVVSAAGTGNTVEGNFIGTDAAGVAAIPNGGSGVSLSGGGQVVAGRPEAPQRIWFNQAAGIKDTALGDVFRVNSITANHGGGIAVSGATPTAVVALAADHRTITIGFSNATPGRLLTAEVFDNPGAPGCPGQGASFLASASSPVTGASAGTLTVTTSQAIPTGDGITATLTDGLKGTGPFVCLAGGVPPFAPVNNAVPMISGTPREGGTLSTTPGIWTGSPTLSYQWQDCTPNGASCANATTSATTPQHRVTSADVGHTLHVIVTATNAGGSVTATSARTPIITTRGPKVSNARLSPSSFDAKTGTTLRLTLSEAATITIVITQTIPGHQVGGHCIANAAKRKACTRTIRNATLHFSATKGAHRFTIRLRNLAPGRHTAFITARDAAGRRSTALALTFTVKKPHR